MSPENRRLAGILLIVLPTIVYGGVSILSLTVSDPTYMTNPLRQDLWRAGHAHAAVLVILSLVVLPYVEEANLPHTMKVIARYTTPASAILLPAAFFLSVVSPTATEPNGMINLAYAGPVVLVVGLVILGVGLLRRPKDST
jgi:hypothetical protein